VADLHSVTEFVPAGVPVPRLGQPHRSSPLLRTAQLVPNHPLQGRMSFAMIHAVRAIDGEASGIRVAGLTRDNHD
jgi:hypothetical protein